MTYRFLRSFSPVLSAVMPARGQVGRAPFRARSVAWTSTASLLGTFILAVSLVACAGGSGGRTPRLLGPFGMAEPGWTIEDRERDIARREVRTSPTETLMWVRVKGAEKPHYHDKTDMTVFVVSGRVTMHMDQRVVDAAAGDVIDVPRGTMHWVENKGKDASVAFVVFSPGFDGRDYRPER